MFWNNFKKAKSGYIAVISAVIVTAIVIVIALVFSSSNFLGRFDTQAIELKSVSQEAALACLEKARLNLKLNPAYAGNETVNVGADTCQILQIEVDGANKIIKASSEIQGRITNLKLVVHGSSLEKISVEELSSF